MKSNATSTRIARYVICMGALLSNLSSGMLNVALLDVANTFGQDVGTTQWVVTIYLLTISVCLPLMGRIGDNRGKRNIHNLGFALFLLGSICCALAPNFGLLLSARIVQGVGAAMYQATNFALIVSLVPTENRGRALGTVSTFVAVGMIIGPSLGGLVVQWMSWRANFWLLAGISAIIGLLAQLVIPRDHPANQTPLDIFGAALFTAGLGAFVTALSMGSSWGWISLPMLALIAIFAASLFVFIRWSRSSRWEKSGLEPFIHISLIQIPAVRLGLLIAIVSYMSAFAAQIVLPIFLRSELGLSPAVAGALMVGYPASLIFSAPISGGLSDKYGSTRIMIAGLCLMALSLTALGFLSQQLPLAYIVLVILLLGSSMGMISSPNNNMILSSVDKRWQSFMGSMSALSRNIGMMCGAILGGTLMNIGTQGGFPLIGLLHLDPVLFGYRSVFLAAALCVAWSAISQIRLARKLQEMTPVK
jgi:EmrB/QacA subfamily drug resistance transporter